MLIAMQAFDDTTRIIINFVDLLVRTYRSHKKSSSQ